MTDYYHLTRDKAFARSYVKKVMKQYGLNNSEALSVFNAVAELMQSRSVAEIRRVQGFCLYAYDNQALQDVYWVITRRMGAYPTDAYPAVLRLRRKLRRDAPDAYAEKVLKPIIKEVLELFLLPDEAWQRGGYVPKVKRIQLFDKPVLNSRGEALAWAKKLHVSRMFEAVLRSAGENAPIVSAEHALTQSAFIKKRLRDDKERLHGDKKRVKLEDEYERDMLYRIIYALARLAMCDTDGQAAAVMGYMRITFHDIYNSLLRTWPEMRDDEYAHMSTRVQPRLRPQGRLLQDEAVDAVAATLCDMAADAEIRKIIGKMVSEDDRLLPVNEALTVLTSYIKDAVKYIHYMGRVSARDKTKTAYNYLNQAEYVELEEMGEAVAMAESAHAAKQIVAAFDKRGREAAERRFFNRIDRLLTADDLV